MGWSLFWSPCSHSLASLQLPSTYRGLVTISMKRKCPEQGTWKLVAWRRELLKRKRPVELFLGWDWARSIQGHRRRE